MVKQPGPDTEPPARPGGPTVAERRVAAQKAALKANMARRKAQMRARDPAPGADRDETE